MIFHQGFHICDSKLGSEDQNTLRLVAIIQTHTW